MCCVLPLLGNVIIQVGTATCGCVCVPASRTLLRKSSQVNKSNVVDSKQSLLIFNQLMQINTMWNHTITFLPLNNSRT